MENLEKRLVLNACEGFDEPTVIEKMTIALGTQIALSEERKRENQEKTLHVQVKLEATNFQLKVLMQQIAILRQQETILHQQKVILRTQAIELQKEDFAIQNRLTELYGASSMYGIKQETMSMKNSAKFICQCNKINGIHFQDEHEPTSIVDISE